MTEALYFYSYFMGTGYELLCEEFDTSNPFGLPGREIVERILAAGYTPVMDEVRRAPFQTAGDVFYIIREGQTFVVSVDPEAEVIMVQEQRDEAYDGRE